MPEVIIIGAGASGLMTAIVAGRNGAKVTIIEKMNKAGKKILATGNGKCNYTNTYYDKKCYRGDDTSIVPKVFEKFSVKKTIKFFKEIGIYPKEKNGYIYPHSEQASSVVEVLMMEIKRLKIDIIYEESVIDIKKTKKVFEVITNKNRYKVDKVVVSAGGKASSKLGSDGSLYNIVKKMGHTIIKPLPALVQLKCTNKNIKKISGVRTSARVQINEHIEQGEIIFTDYGISGIPIMQLSRYASKLIDKKKKVMVHIDLLPDLTKEEVLKLLKQRKKDCPYKNNYEVLVGLLNNKLANFVQDKKINCIVENIKNMELEIMATNPFDNAQVTAGGVSTKEIEAHTMQSKIVKNLYFTGEIIDIDGTCGGYNLQWAWSTGYIAGMAISSDIFKGEKGK